MINYEEINANQTASEVDPFTEERYQQFFNYFLPTTKIVLDVGCNTGRGGRIIKNLNQDLYIVGLDCLETRLAKIPREVYSQTLCCYSSDISVPDNHFDAILAGEFIEHIAPAEVEATLKEFYRVLAPQGRVLLTTPNPNYIRLKLTGGSVLGGAHLSEHYPVELQQKLATQGFKNIKVYGSGKMSRFFGEKFPIFSVYGSYLIIADKI
jgi:SAM-dependent methyltransferase